MRPAAATIRVTKLVLALTVTLLCGAAAAASQGGRAPAREYPRQFGYVTMKDGVRLAYVVYLPEATGRFPAVLQYEPYLGGGSGPGSWWPAALWLENGYAVVFASVRGTGCSQGVFDLLGPHEGPDGATLIDWIGSQPWSDRRVGMIGASYPGHTQILVAAQHPRFLEAITPSAVTASTYGEVAYPGGILNIGFVSEWALHLQPALEAAGVKARIGWGDRECAANYSAHPPSHLFSQALAHPFLDAWWKSRSLETYVGRVSVPTFISGTWQDNETMGSGTTELYERLRGPKHLSLSPGGHGWVYLQLSLQQDLVRWMDRWVKGVRNGIEALAPVTIYWEPKGYPPVAGWTTHYGSWPPARAESRTFWLTSQRTLSRSPPAAAPTQTGPGPLSYTFPTGVELIGNDAQFALAPDPYGSLTWTSAPFTADFMLLGSIQVTLYAASQNRDTDFEVAVHDVYPDGAIEYLQRGYLRASLREVDRDASGDLAHPYDRPSYLIPGHVYEFRLSLPPLGAVLRKGHRLQLVVLAPSPIPQPHWGLMPVAMAGENTVYTSARYPSNITVPFIPGAGAEGPEPGCGSLAFQPCRAPRRH